MFSTFNSVQSFLIYFRNSVSNIIPPTFTYNFPTLDPSLVLYYPLDSSANPSNGFQTANFASQLPVYDASLAGSSMISYAPSNTITSFGDLSLNNTMGSQLVPQTVSGNYVVSNTSFALNISGGFSISLWFSCSGQLNQMGTMLSLPYNKSFNGIEIDISGTNMIYIGWNPPPGPIDLLTTVGKSAMIGTSPIFTGSISGTTLTVTVVRGGKISLNMTITGTNINAGTKITAFGTGRGGTGTYIVSVSKTVASTTITGKLSAGAYGVRLLYSAYMGPVIQIKAGTGGTAIDYYADTSGNLGTAYLGTGTSLTTNLGVETAYVTKWYDQTGNMNDGTAVNTPVYNTSMKTVDFATGFFSIPTYAYPYGNSAYTFIYTPNNQTVAEQCIYSGGVAAGGNIVQAIINFASNNMLYFNGWFGNSMYITGSGTFLNGTKIADRYNGTTSTGRSLYFDNLQQTVTITGSTARNQSFSPNWLGRTPDGETDNTNYTGTLQFFYWAPTELTENDLTQLCNTPTN